MIWVFIIVIGAALWFLLEGEGSQKNRQPAQKQPRVARARKKVVFSPGIVSGPDPDFDGKMLALLSARNYDSLGREYLKAWNKAEDRYFETGDDAYRAAAFIYKQNEVRFYIARWISDLDIDDLENFELSPGMTEGCVCGPIGLKDFISDPTLLPCRKDCPCNRLYPCDPIIRPKDE